MRWDPNDELWRGLPENWEPQLINPSLVAGAQEDPGLWDKTIKDIAGYDVVSVLGAKAWASSVRMALKLQAPTLGLPASLSGTIVDAFGQVMLGRPRDVGELATKLAQTGIGIAANALSAMPVVGPIAGAIGAVVNVILQLRSRTREQAREFFPPQIVYSAAQEGLTMNVQVLPVLEQTDWNTLFIPRLGTNFYIDQREDVLGAWVLNSNGNGVGFVPGSQVISSEIQVRLVKKSDRDGGNSADWRDVGDFYPGPAQLLTTVASQVQTPTAALYSVRPKQILAEWREYLEAVTAFCTDIYNGIGIKGTGLEKLTEEQRHVVVSTMMAPYCTTTLKETPMRGALVTWAPGYNGDTIVDAFVEPWCRTVEQRQEHYLDTIVCAYVDQNSPGVRSTFRRLRQLRRNRRLLLESPARYHVDLDDVIDDDYRKELFEATVGSTLVAPTTPDGAAKPIGIDGGQAPPEPDPMPPSGRPPFAGEKGASSSGGAAALALAGLLGVGLIARRRGTRR